MIEKNYKELNIGQAFKNYKELQTFLEEPYKQGGKARQLQLADWQRFFDYTKEGQKYTITDVYEHPTPKTDHRGESGNRAIYSKHIEILILDILQHTRNGNWTGNKAQLYTELGLVGKNYHKYHYSDDSKQDLILRFHLITQWELSQFFQRADNKLHSIVMSVLRSMADKSLIKLEERIMINARIGGTYVADERDKKAILKAENEVLKKMGYKTKSQVYLAHKMESFYDQVRAILKERYDWNNHYKLIHIMSNKDRNEIALTEAKKEYEQLCLNNKFFNYMQDNAVKEYQRMIEYSYEQFEKSGANYFFDLDEDEYTKIDADRADIFYPPSTYIDAQHLIGNITIPLDTEKIYEDYFSEQLENEYLAECIWGNYFDFDSGL